MNLNAESNKVCFIDLLILEEAAPKPDAKLAKSKQSIEH